jgi:hypothetical protein
MDFLSHALWAYLIAKVAGIALWPQFVFFAVFPDLAFGLPLGAYWLFKLSSRPRKFYARSEIRKLIRGDFKWLEKVYHVAHSFVTVAIFALFDWVAYGPAGVAALGGWVLHCALDTFMHKEGVVTAMPLYPLGYEVRGFFHWSEKWFLALNYSLLAVAYAWFFFLK